MQLGFMMTTVDEGTVFNLVVLISRQLARKTVGMCIALMVVLIFASPYN